MNPFNEFFYQNFNRTARQNEHFMDLVNDKVNPLTNKDLIALIKRFPDRWQRFSKFIGKLKD